MGMQSKILPSGSPGWIPSSTDAIQRQTDTDFNNLLEFSIVIFYSYNQIHTDGEVENATIFSMFHDTATDTGIKLWGYTTDWYASVASSATSSANRRFDTWYAGPTSSASQQTASPLSCVVYTCSASNDSQVTYHLNSGRTSTASASVTLDDTDGIGAVGTNTYISIGHYHNGGATSEFCGSDFKIKKVSLWKNKVLTNAEVQALTNATGTITNGATDPLFLRDIGWENASVTQPNHEWVMNSINKSDGVHNQTLLDTGVNVDESVAIGRATEFDVDGTAAANYNVHNKEIFKDDGTLIGVAYRMGDTSIKIPDGALVALSDGDNINTATVPDTGSTGGKHLERLGPNAPGKRFG